MKNNSLLIIPVLLIVGITAIYLSQTNSSTNITPTINSKPNSGSTTIVNSTQGNTQSKSIMLSSSQYFSISYKIFPGKLTAQSTRALIGIQMSNTTTLNGTMVKLSVNGNPISNVLVPNNDSLYFIEASYGDDFGSYEGSLGDDGILLVNSSGYIIG